MKEFIKLNKEELEQSMLEDVVASTGRAVARKRMDLEEAVASAKRALKTVSTITTLTGFDATRWVDNRNHALNKVKLAMAELENFNENFKSKAE